MSKTSVYWVADLTVWANAITANQFSHAAIYVGGNLIKNGANMAASNGTA